MVFEVDANLGSSWGKGVARYFSIEGDFLDEEHRAQLMPVPENFMCPISGEKLCMMRKVGLATLPLQCHRAFASLSKKNELL